MEEEFFNAFATSDVTITAAQNMNLENEMGTLAKPPKLVNFEDYDNWSERFINWVQANHFTSWFAIESKYTSPTGESGLEKTLAPLTNIEKEKYISEKKMINKLQHAVKEDILALLHHDDDAQSLWNALRLKFQGSSQLRKGRKALLSMEFDIFNLIKGETMKQLIERFCHLVVQMKQIRIFKTNEELVDKLADSLIEGEWTNYMTGTEYSNFTLPRFIERLEGHELEIQKMAKNKGAHMQQDVNLYYKGSSVGNIQSHKVQTAFSANNTMSPPSNQFSGFQSFPSYNPNSPQAPQSSQNLSNPQNSKNNQLFCHQLFNQRN